MSTTVKYKGNTIASLDGETKVLATRGKWIENDIEITDISVDGIGEGNVYQDEDGYIIIDESDSEPITVKSATMTTNGEYVAPAGIAYSPIIVNVPERGENYIDRTMTEIIAEDLEGITSIGSYAFSNCTNLEAIDFGYTVETIGTYAFYQCTKLENVAISDTVTSIGAHAFESCAALKNITFPENVIELQDYSFRYSGLTNIVIPSTLQTISHYAFSSTNLETIVIPKTVINMGAHVFEGCKLLKSAEIYGKKTWLSNTSSMAMFSGCTSLEKVKIIGLNFAGNGNEFLGCTSLTDVYCPDGNILTIASFRNCTSLERIALPKTNACNSTLFQNCSSLEKVDFGVRTQFYQGNIFQNCSSLTTIVLRGTALTSLTYTNVFDGTPFAEGGTGGTIYIPKVLYDELGTGSSLDYKAATNWSTFDGYGTITWAQIEGSEYEHYYVDGRGVLQTVTTNLTNCSISNDIAHYHTEFETEVVADNGYSISSVTVTMNGVNITSTAYDSAKNTINISSPDGEIVITATAA